MARKKRRGPPKSYEQKWRQINKSRFGVTLPYPDTPTNKRLTTIYHRQIFGGRSKKTGKQTFGLNSRFTPTTNKKADLLIPPSERKGIPRVTAHLLPKGFRVRKSVDKNSVNISGAGRLETNYIFNKRQLAENPDAEINRVLKRVRKKEFRIRFGNRLLPTIFTDKERLIGEYKRLAREYKKEKDKIHIVTVTPTNQSTVARYVKAKRKANRSN